jgi:hypothetical protein
VVHFHVAVFIESQAAVVAVTGAEVVFLAAALAAVAELSGGHGEEQAVVAFDQLHVANDERVVEGERAECFEPAAVSGAEADADF